MCGRCASAQRAPLPRATASPRSLTHRPLRAKCVASRLVLFSTAVWRQRFALSRPGGGSDGGGSPRRPDSAPEDCGASPTRTRPAPSQVLTCARLRGGQVNPERTLDVRPKLQALLAEEGELRALAQKAFVSYMRSVFLQPNKEVFNVDKLDGNGFAEVRRRPVHAPARRSRHARTDTPRAVPCCSRLASRRRRASSSARARRRGRKRGSSETRTTSWKS